MAVHSAALGLRLSVKMYPEGTRVRDRGQLDLLDRFRVRVPLTVFGWGSEVLIGGEGDLRAWDARLDGPPGSIGIDAETRLHDIQATQRRMEAKQRDGHVDRMIMLVAATRHNRRVLALHRHAPASTFPGDTAEILIALKHGRLPPVDGIVVL